MSYFTYKGRPSRDFGLTVQYIPPIGGASRDIETISIPGKSGLIPIDNRRYNNVLTQYDTFFQVSPGNIQNVSRKIKAWLLGGSVNYYTLEDTYNPDYFRMAFFSGPMDIENRFFRFGRTVLEFNCKPQWFSKDGMHVIRMDSEGPIRNPEAFTSRPTITVYGSGAGNLYVNNATCQLLDIDKYIVIDSETENAYRGIENKNLTVNIKPYPTLRSGDNYISWDGGVSHIEVTPRWFTI